MAKILLGPTVIGVRGTVAGITFSQNKAGPYARGWHTPPNPRTGLQTGQRAKLASWAASWGLVSAVNQATWNTYAAAPAQVLTDSLGQPYAASGFNWYVTINTALAMIGAAATLIAPVAARPAVPIVTSFLWTNASTSQPRWRMAVGSPGLALNHLMRIRIFNSAGIKSAPKKYQWMRVTIPNISRDVHCQSEMHAKYGTTVVGMSAFGSIQVIGADGQVSAAVLNSTVSI